MRKFFFLFIIIFSTFFINILYAEVEPVLSLSGDDIANILFELPSDTKLYADAITFDITTPDGQETELSPIKEPEPIILEDGISYFTNNVAFSYQLPPPASNVTSIEVGWQVCVGDICLLPATKIFPLNGVSNLETSYELEDKDETDVIELPGELILKRKWEKGYAGSDDFLKFLADSEISENLLERVRAKGGVFLVIVFVILGGLSLNLTPCILPLIPVNLAILGIGAHGSSRKEGFAVGASFGLGIALSYGFLAIITALTGSVFGGLQTSTVFNAIIAIVFSVLALAMLGVFNIDFSSLGNKFKKNPTGNVEKQAPNKALRHVGAFFAGAGSALLAGACVAPMLIWTLVMSATLVSEGIKIGILLPLLLGIGMGLPWPFLGGGVATPPRPGKWMNIVKYIFAVIFLLFAIHYTRLAFGVSFTKSKTGDDSEIEWIDDDRTLGDSYAENNKPILLYLTTDTCAACRKMEATTFKNSEVVETMRNFNANRVNCTDISNPEIDRLLKSLGVKGFPFFAIFETEDKSE